MHFPTRCVCVCDCTLVPGAIPSFVGAMKASDWQELQRLLVLADRQGFVQEALIETGIAKKEQLPIVPGQKFQACLRGETTTDWKGYAQVNAGMMVPKAKAKPVAKQMIYKGGESSECSGSTGATTGTMVGAMTDASKRRLPVDEDWEQVDPGSEEDDDAFAYQMPYGAPFLPANQLGVAPIPEAERGFSPGVAYDNVNPRVPIPRTCKTAMEWGRTLVVMPKFKHLNLTYEGLVNQALAGDDAVVHYLEWLTKTYGPKYLEGPVRSQGPDLAGYVLHVNVEFPQRYAPVEFRRQLV